MRGNWKRGALIAALLASAAAASGCAQEIGDIDRTEPNRVKKSDLTSGSWWMHQKVVEVPGSASLEAFEGLMMETDKVVFVAEENYLLAKRSYPILPGSDNQTLNVNGQNNYEEIYGTDYQGNVLAMFPITSHFDVQRTYDAATGEQSNVIVENTSDRPWYERDYMHVDWHQNPMVNFEWALWYDMDYQLGYQEVYENDPLKGSYFEYDDNGQLVYFDAPATYVIQPTIWDWFYGLIGYQFTDTNGAVEVRVVTSFGKDLGMEADSVLNYEPLRYPNQDMNRFGYFRTERYTYDPQLGMMNAGRIELANRHNIWQAAYDANGNVIPVENRVVRTIPYYIFDGVKEAKLAAMSEQVIDEWNVAFKRAVYIMQHPENTILQGVDLVTTVNYDTLKPLLSGQQDIFVPCHIPVADGDNPVCGEKGFVPREGDFRKNFLWLVNQRQDVGLLGYCPSVTDPLTGQTLSAQAHVYTAPMNEIANSLIDQIKFAKGELTPEGVRANDAAIARATNSRERFIDMSKMSDAVRSARLNSPKARADKMQRRAERTLAVKNLRKFDYASADNKLKNLIDTGMLRTDVDSGIMSSMMKLAGVKSSSQLPAEAKEAASLYKQLSFTNRATVREMQKALSARGYCFKDNAASYDIMYSAIVDKYKDRSDYENIFNELRAQVFRSTALHEMGHGFGLRHNHTGSYDSMNYFDNYWNLRRDANFSQKKISSVGDMYKLYDYSEDQLKGGMLVNMYSSIMDYSNGYTTDLQGLGKYDHAAILYAYSAGTSTHSSAKSSNGLVEIFTKAPGAANEANVAGIAELGKVAYSVLKHEDTTKTSTFDDQTTVGQNYLELIHYHDFFQSDGMRDYDFRKNRGVARMDKYLENKSSWVRVPYLFCTDDNRGSLRSCHVFDHGADYYEQISDIIRTYSVNYWFTNFARGRAFWEAYGASMRYYRGFFMLSDYLQSDYVGDWQTLRDILDANGTTLNDDVSEAASGATFNFLANVIATPEYGLFCRRTDNGHLYSLSSDDEASSEVSEFSQRSRCGRDAEYFYVRQGEGRHRYQKYDVNAGFDYSMYELELEHNYTSLWAILALFDNEANVIVDSGDMGTYTLGIYSRFREQAIRLSNGVIAEDYSIHGPRLLSDDGNGNKEMTTYNGDQMETGHLVYPSLVTSTYYNEDGTSVEYNPLTGESVSYFNALGATVPAFGVCKQNSDCVAPDNAAEVICDTLTNDQKDTRCFPLYWEKADAKCVAGSEAYDLGGEWGCIPSDFLHNQSDDFDASCEKLASVACSADNVTGACEEGKTCINGTCSLIARRVETDTSLTQKYYMTIYGMLLTGPIEMDPMFYDQFNVFRVGSGQQNAAAPGYKQITFSNPYTGEVFGANDYNCEKLEDGSYTSTCYSSMREFDRPGSAMLVEKAQNLADQLIPLWDEVIELNGAIDDSDPDYENSEEYQKFMDVYYKWYRTKYDLESAIRDLNLVRNVYDYFGTVW